MNKKNKNEPQEATTESEIRERRKFNLTEALGRENSDLLKGASPVARGDQVLLEIQQYLGGQLDDPAGSLQRTIIARLKGNPPLLAKHFENPLGALAKMIADILGSDRLLADLVRDTDARWGRDYQERPFFESDGQPASPDDPYTIAKVRVLLKDLLAEL